MRASLRLLAHVKPGTFLEANAPTGLTGLFTHPSPRPALILTYRKTLEQLKQIPTTSVYRQSTEALTKHRLSIVESTKPAGHAEWLSRIQKTYDGNPDAFKGLKRPDSGFAHVKTEKSTNPNWDGKLTRADALPEGANTEAMANAKAKAIQEEVDESERPPVSTFDDLEVEPPLDSEQINEIETKIGAGLIEEVLQVAEGELTLVNEMAESKIWEALDEKPAPGQWEYFERPKQV